MLTKDEIIKIATLSRLSLTDAEMEKYQKELSGILGFFEMLSEVDTEGVEPTAQITGLENGARIDTVSSFTEGDLLACSPQRKAGTQVSVAPVF